jgi:hypothetical protein
MRSDAIRPLQICWSLAESTTTIASCLVKPYFQKRRLVLICREKRPSDGLKRCPDTAPFPVLLSGSYRRKIAAGLNHGSNRPRIRQAACEFHQPISYHDRPGCESGCLKLVTTSLLGHPPVNSLVSILSVASTKPEALPAMINPKRLPSQGPCHAAKNPPISAPAGSLVKSVRR